MSSYENEPAIAQHPEQFVLELIPNLYGGKVQIEILDEHPIGNGAGECDVVSENTITLRFEGGITDDPIIGVEELIHAAHFAQNPELRATQLKINELTRNIGIMRTKGINTSAVLSNYGIANVEKIDLNRIREELDLLPIEDEKMTPSDILLETEISIDAMDVDDLMKFWEKRIEHISSYTELDDICNALSVNTNHQINGGPQAGKTLFETMSQITNGDIQLTDELIASIQDLLNIATQKPLVESEQKKLRTHTKKEVEYAMRRGFSRAETLSRLSPDLDLPGGDTDMEIETRRRMLADSGLVTQLLKDPALDLTMIIEELGVTPDKLIEGDPFDPELQKMTTVAMDTALNTINGGPSNDTALFTLYDIDRVHRNQRSSIPSNSFRIELGTLAHLSSICEDILATDNAPSEISRNRTTQFNSINTSSLQLKNYLTILKRFEDMNSNKRRIHSLNITQEEFNQQFPEFKEEVNIEEMNLIDKQMREIALDESMRLEMIEKERDKIHMKLELMTETIAQAVSLYYAEKFFPGYRQSGSTLMQYGSLIKATEKTKTNIVDTFQKLKGLQERQEFLMNLLTLKSWSSINELIKQYAVT